MTTNENVYFGSTCEPTLARRLAEHTKKYKQYVKGDYGFNTSFDIIKNGNYKIILIEKFPCNYKDELHARESFYIQNEKCINKHLPNNYNKMGKELYDKEYA